MAGIAPHRRRNPLTGEWVLVSPQRTERPWQGQEEAVAEEQRPTRDPGCYLCPGSERAGGARNPDYEGTHVFTNDFPALVPAVERPVDEDVTEETHSLFETAAVAGTSRVICFSPRHDLTLAEMEPPAIEKVIDVWSEQTASLGAAGHAWVQVFENKGAAMGCSNPHPHGQVWATDYLPTEPGKEDAAQRAYLEAHGELLLLSYARAEAERRERIVEDSELWLAVVPYWALWPFEVLVMPKRRIARLTDLTGAERAGLAGLLSRLLARYDNLFRCSFPYSMGWHGAPFGDESTTHWQLHGHFLPPLLRSATVKKFLVGFEMLAEAQRDLTPELAAQRLREVSPVHYKRSGANG